VAVHVDAEADFGAARCAAEGDAREVKHIPSAGRLRPGKSREPARPPPAPTRPLSTRPGKGCQPCAPFVEGRRLGLLAAPGVQGLLRDTDQRG
jgi:hypothetical protein